MSSYKGATTFAPKVQERAIEMVLDLMKSGMRRVRALEHVAEILDCSPRSLEEWAKRRGLKLNRATAAEWVIEVDYDDYMAFVESRLRRMRIRLELLDARKELTQPEETQVLGDIMVLMEKLRKLRKGYAGEAGKEGAAGPQDALAARLAAAQEV